MSNENKKIRENNGVVDPTYKCIR